MKPVLAIIVFLCFFSFCYAQEVDLQRPRFLYTAVEIEDFKKDRSKIPEIQNVVKQADLILSERLNIPEKEGDWIFYYFCPKDDAMLKSETETRHICPVCGAVYTDERTSAAYRTHINYKIDRNCVTLAKAYAFTGQLRYAESVKSILLKLASIYPGFERHDRWGRRGILALAGGKRYAQHLDEAISAIDLAGAYDLVADADCFSEKERKICEDFLKSIVKEILKYQIFVGKKNNHQTWFNAAYTVVGLVTSDKDLMNEGIHGKYGLLWQVENSITEDGLWYEGTIAYHFYALSAIQYTLDAAKRAGWDFSKNERLKSMWLGPVNLAYPDGKLPVFHDSDPVNLKNYKSYFLWAYEYFKESVFAQYAGIEVSHTQIKNPESVNLSDIGIAVLRRGKGADQVCAMLDYGIHGDAHGHPDKLNIVLYALGRELMLDPGRISYSVPEYRTWCRTTVAHNTVVVDGKDQQPATGKLLYFGETEHYSACLAVCDSAYPGYVIKRFLALFDTFLIDFLTVEGKEKKQMDWIIHCRGKILHKNSHRLFESLGDKNGYQHLKDIQKHDNISQDVYQFVQEDGKILRVFLPDEKNYEIFTGTGIGYHLKDKVAFLLRRGCSEKAGFIAVYDFSETEQDRIKKIERIPVISCDAKKLLKDKAIGLRILTGSKIFTIGMDMRENIKDLPAVGNKKFERFSMNVENISSGNN